MPHSLHFEQIDIKGFRGRNFNLKMNPRGQHTVFVMDGNTGKTTVIELLRWCFKHPQNNAMGNFSHMYIVPAHVLDHNISGIQECSIQIVFTALDEQNNEHIYRFRRDVIGEHVLGYDKTGDKIDVIADIFDIDNGDVIFKGDEANEEMNKIFRLNECADYVCFDGEKAREIMQLTSNSKKIESLLKIINARVTSYKMKYIKERLLDIRKKVYSASRSRMTEQAISRNENDLNYWIGEQNKLQDELSEIKLNLAAYDFNINQLQDQYDNLESEINASKQESLIQRLNYTHDLENKSEAINFRRNELYKHSLTWINLNEELIDLINEIKLDIKETGSLPEPYREDLINLCLKKKSCIICGRDFEEGTKEYIQKLGKQIASDDVHQFLSNALSVINFDLDPKKIQITINTLFNEIHDINLKIQSLDLTTEDITKINMRDSIKAKITGLKYKKDELEKKHVLKNDRLTDIKLEVQRLEERMDILQENKIILDKIIESLELIENAEEEIEKKVIDIISQVISEGVTSILGQKFSAKLSINEGLMLGEDGYYGIDRGGYSGRLILSYCFAEAMTLVDPIIVDTPSGNVGSHRLPLAEHLAKNHSQVILMCLPSETDNFAPILNKNTIDVFNLGGNL